MRILGIETSCDETGAAIIEGETNDEKVNLLSNVVASSLTLHSKTGGIIPEKAAREQVKYIIPVIKKALRGHRHSGNSERSVEASRISHSDRRFWASSPRFAGEAGQNDNSDIDAIAVTVGPGLIGSLLVGVETAKTLAYAWNKPIIPVNHLIGHVYANFIDQKPFTSVSLRETERSVAIPSNKRLLRLRQMTDPRNDKITFPSLALIVSGGHTDLVLMKRHGSIKWLGGTRDDAAGEAFDKIGRLLGLPYPGGPAIEKAAKKGNPKAFNFPRPMIGSNDFDFSFSGLKTSVLNLINKNRWKFDNSRAVILGSVATPESPTMMRDSGQARMTKTNNKLIYDLTASVQQAIVDVLIAKTLKAAKKYKVKSILLGGGVSANQKLRDQFALEIRNLKLEIPLSVPPKHLCTDNGAMIATAAFFNYKPTPWRKITANPELYFD